MKSDFVARQTRSFVNRTLVCVLLVVVRLLLFVSIIECLFYFKILLEMIFQRSSISSSFDRCTSFKWKKDLNAHGRLVYWWWCARKTFARTSLLHDWTTNVYVGGWTFLGFLPRVQKSILVFHQPSDVNYTSIFLRTTATQTFCGS